MAQIVFTTATSVATKVMGLSGPTAHFLKLGGSIAGQAVDHYIDADKVRISEGQRLDTLEVQSSAYGQAIPIIYGTLRLAGNIIWSTPIKETSHVTRQRTGGKGGGGRITQRTDYHYSVSLAIGLGEGIADNVHRIWANNRLLDLSSIVYRFYKGDEEQLPDPLIEAIEGIGRTPAYRGLAYMVFEDFPLEEFGNHIPNFVFEVERRLFLNQHDKEGAEQLIRSMVMIPGSGEFVYDPVIHYKQSATEYEGHVAAHGFKSRINHHNHTQDADAVLSLNHMESVCPNVEWVAPVVTWFGNHLDAGECVIKPGVEQSEPLLTTPEHWRVGNYTRNTAHLLSRDENDRPVYGGTVHDASVLRYLDLLKERGYKIMFYPMFFMDVLRKPWRGRVSGSYSDVMEFFVKSNGYDEFIMHYTQLIKGKVDAFVIGSELIGLTSVCNEYHYYPAVDALVDLAQQVKSVLGDKVIVTYAADWSEYHHTEGGWYHLDPLWASPNIDVVGIDAYFPLTDNADTTHITRDSIIKGWHSGEGYSWVYLGGNKQDKVQIEPRYAWKDLAYWWEHVHINPDGKQTSWQPKSKPIWFTEYGFPSVDGASNQPNVFVDPNSSEGAYPRYSRKTVDFTIQRKAIEATEIVWRDSQMVQNMFLWTWDARPYPYWPRLREVWADYSLWKTGHWIQGKFGLSSLAAIIIDLCRRAGLHRDDIDVSKIDDYVDGFVLSYSMSVLDALHVLQQAYFVDIFATDGVLHFIQYKRFPSKPIELSSDNIVSSDGSDAVIKIHQDIWSLPYRIHARYIDKIRDYQKSHLYVTHEHLIYEQSYSLSLPLVMTESDVQFIAHELLQDFWTYQTRFIFEIYEDTHHLLPGTIIRIVIDGALQILRILFVIAQEIYVYRIEAVPYMVDKEKIGNAALPISDSQLGHSSIQYQATIGTICHFLDLPHVPSQYSGEHALLVAMTGDAEGWPGAVLYRSLDGGEHYERLLTVTIPAIIGQCVSQLSSGPITVVDRVNKLDVNLIQGQLFNVSSLAFYNGANSALVGDEIIQFQQAVLKGPDQYRLSNFLRARQATDGGLTTHQIGERFILLNDVLSRYVISPQLIGVEVLYKAVTLGQDIDDVELMRFTYVAKSNSPLLSYHGIERRW